jgi:hypothetical protein
LVTIDRADVLLLNHTHYGRVRVVTSEASKYPRSVRHSGLFGRIARARKQSSRGLREGGSDVTLGCCRYTSSVQLPPIPRLSPRTLSFCGSSAVNRTLRRRKRRAPETNPRRKPSFAPDCLPLTVRFWCIIMHVHWGNVRGTVFLCLLYVFRRRRPTNM